MGNCHGKFQAGLSRGQSGFLFVSDRSAYVFDRQKQIKKQIKIGLTTNLKTYILLLEVNKMKQRLVLSLALMFLFIITRYAHAAFSVSATPYEGGYDLRFGKIDPASERINREVTVNIISDIAKQYRLTQTLLDPLSTPEGNRIPETNLVVYGIRGSNKFGTINVEQEIPVFLGRSVIYTSNQQGASDSFTLVYSLKGPFDVPSGLYRGRISFMLEPIDTSQAPATVILNIFSEIVVESAIEIKTVSGGKYITLNSMREEERCKDVLVNIEGGFGSQFRITQILPQPLLSSEGYQLSGGAVNFLVKEAKKGTGPSTAENLSLNKQPMYTSGPRGESDSFIITYSLGNLETEKAGRYRGAIKYLLEGSGYIKEGLIDTLTLEVENERIFDLIVSPEMGGLIQFQDLKPHQPPRVSEVVFEVKTNIGEAYQISQTVISEFTNKEGNIIPMENFNLRMESLDTKGVLKFPTKTQVNKGDMVLFISDSNGPSDRFKAVYELSVPDDLQAGDYSTQIVYSISEL